MMVKARHRLSANEGNDDVVGASTGCIRRDTGPVSPCECMVTRDAKDILH